MNVKIQNHKLYLNGIKYSCYRTNLDFSYKVITELRYLNLRDNKLKIIPGSIIKLKQLSMLLLDDNQITELPENIGELKKLFFLSVSNNRLTKLPASIQDIPELILLNIEGNNIALNEFLQNFKNTFLQMNDVGGFDEVRKPVFEPQHEGLWAENEAFYKWIMEK